MLQIVETRIISVTSWYHLAFFVISIAMFGLTAGAVWVYLRPERYRPEQLSYHLSAASLSFALATILALLVQLTIVTSLPASVMSLVVWTEFAVALSSPVLLLRHRRQPGPDPQPLPRRRGLWDRPARRGSRLPRSPRSAQSGQWSLGSALDCGPYCRRRPVLRAGGSRGRATRAGLWLAGFSGIAALCLQALRSSPSPTA